MQQSKGTLVWESKNGLWEITMENSQSKNKVYLYSKNDIAVYSIGEDEEGWAVVQTQDEIPAYVRTAVTRNYKRLQEEGTL